MPWHEVVVFKRLELGEVKKNSFAHDSQESKKRAEHAFFIALDLLRQTKEMFPGKQKQLFKVTTRDVIMV